MGSSRESQTFLHANSKGVDQPVPPRRLMSVFVIRLLENIIYKLASGKNVTILATLRS